jgi:peroxiredoxin
MVGNMAAEDATVLTEAMKKLLTLGIEDSSLKVGDKLPSFVLPNVAGKQVSGKDLFVRGRLVVSFFRGGWCPFCDLELRALEIVKPKMEELGASLVAISPQMVEKTEETANSRGLSYEVLSDGGNKFAKSCGLVFSLPEEIRPLYKKFGIDLSIYNDDFKYELPVPATYIVSHDKMIEYAFVDADYTKRLDPEDIIKYLKKHQ